MLSQTWLWVIAVLLILGVWWYVSNKLRKKRMGVLAAFASARGWTYTPDDPSLIDLSDSDPFNQGHSRQAKDAFNGNMNGHDFVSFEYIYEQTEGSGDDERTVTYHNMVTCVVTPPSQYRLEVRRAGMFSGFLGALGIHDLQLESVDFNKKFHIKANPERFAYDVLNPQTMQRMLADERYSQPLRFENGRLMTWRSGKLDENQVEVTVRYLIDTLEPIPPYAWEQH